MKIELPLDPQSTEEPEYRVNVSTMFLTGEVNIALVTDLVKNLMEIEVDNQNSQYSQTLAQIMINTPGGDLYSAWMLCDVMSMMHNTVIETVGLGQVASAGFMIFMNGTKGHRVATKNTQFMTHRYAMALEATHANIRSQTPEFERMHQRITEHYKKCTGLSDKIIDKVLLAEHDTWLTADDCKKYNICDVIADIDQNKKRKQRNVK